MYSLAHQARSAFYRTTAALSDGTALSATGFRSRFRTLSASGRARKSPRLLPNPLREKTFVEFQSFQERNAAFLDKVTSSKDIVLSLCQSTFDNHGVVLDLLRTATALGPPIKTEQLHHSSDGLKIERHVSDSLRKAVWEFDRRDGHMRAVYGLNRQHLTQLHRFQSSASFRTTSETLRSRSFLPRMVLVACAIAVMTETAWNLETTLSLTAKNIRISDGNYHFVGVKARSNSIHDIELRSTENTSTDGLLVISSVAQKAIELLLGHGRSIAEQSGLENPALFLSYNLKEGGPLQFKRFKINLEAHKFYKYHGYEHIQFKELRQLAAHIDYLSPGGNIFTTQALLQHADPQTTLIYLNTTLISKLLEENSRRFMSKLAATTLFITGRSGKIKESGLSKSDVQKRLFPSSEYSDETSISDEWAANMDAPITIGKNELAHCAYQFAYYKMHFNRMITDNPTKFVKMHFPRLLFCLTMRRVILSSPHAALYRAIEMSRS